MLYKFISYIKRSSSVMQILKKRQIYRLTSEESGGRLLSAWGMETRASLVMLDRTKSFSSTSRQYQAISIPSRHKKSGSIEADAFRVPWNKINKPNVVSLTKIGKLIFWADNVYFYNIVQKNTIKIHCFNSNLNDSWYSIICSDLIYSIIYYRLYSNVTSTCVFIGCWTWSIKKKQPHRWR